MDIVQAVSGFIVGLGIILPFFLKAKGIIKEVSDLLITLSSALEDNSISTEEIKLIVKDANELLGIFKK